MNRLYAWLQVLLLMCALSMSASAQTFPTKPIHLVVPWPAGSTEDVAARWLGTRLTYLLETLVIIDNRSGANGRTGTESVARADPDGYTLLRGDVVTHAINPAAFGKMPYDPLADFVPIAALGRSPMLLLVNNDLAVNSIDDLVQLAKSTPTGLHYASPGPDTPQHAAAEILKQSTGVRLVPAHYPDESSAISAVVSGRVPFTFALTTSGGAYVVTSKVKAILITHTQRLPVLPEVPTAVEAGLSDLQLSAWAGLFAPKGTPKVIVDRLNAAVSEAMSGSDVQDAFAQSGSDAMIGSPQTLTKVIETDLAKWANILKRAGIRE